MFGTNVCGLRSITGNQVLYKQSPVGLPASLTLANGETVAIPEAEARVIQEAVVDTVGRTFAMPSRN